LEGGDSMSRKDIIMIRQKELRRLHVIHRVLDGEITQVKASEMLSLSERQIRRIVKRIGHEGDIGIVHKSRGKESRRNLKFRQINVRPERHRRGKQKNNLCPSVLSVVKKN